MTNDSTKTRNENYVYMDLLETEAISINDDECLYFNEYGSVKRVCVLLNELNNENKALKKQLETEHTMLDNAILLERTRMGQNSLKQFKESLR